MIFIDIFGLNPQIGNLNENKNNLFIDIFGLNPQISDYFLFASLTKKIEN